MQQQSLTLFADYFQFYVQDEGINPDAPTEWNDADVERRLKAAPNVVVVCPVRNMTVPVTVQVFDKEPQYDPSQWHHIAECSLALPTGKLQIHECTGGSVGRFTVSPGNYGLRAFYGSLVSLRDNDLEGDDHYLVVLWPSPPIELKVLKQHPL